MVNGIWQQLVKSKAVKALLVVMLLLLVVVVSLPHVVRSVVISQLEALGPDSVALEKVELNLFTGTFAIRGLSIETSGFPSLNLKEVSGDLALSALFKRQLYIQDFLVSGLELGAQQTSEGKWLIALPLPEEAEVTDEPAQLESDTDEGLSFGIDRIRVEDSKFLVATPQIESEIKLNQGQFLSLYSWLPDNKSQLNLVGALNGAPYQMTFSLSPLADDQGLEGTAKLSSLSLEFLKGLLKENLNNVSGNLDFDLALSVNKKPNEGLAIKVNGDTSLVDLALQPKDVGAQVRVGRLSWKGNESVLIADSEKSGPDVSLEGDLSVEEFKLAKGNEALGAFSKLALNKVSLKLKEQMFSAEAIQLSDSGFHISRDEKGRWLSGLLAQTSDSEESARQEVNKQETSKQEKIDEKAVEVEKQTKKEPDFTFAINKFSMDGENIIYFKDQMVEPEFTRKLTVENLTLNNISNQKGAAPLNLNLKAREHEYGTLSVEGKVSDFAGKPTGNIKTSLSGVELAPLSAYAEQVIGYHINTGQFSLDSSVELGGGKVNASNTIKVVELDMEAKNQQVIDQLGKQLTMPVDTAVSLLKDGDGVIELPVPIEGDINNPDIKLGEAIRTATFQAVKGAAFNYMLYALQPYGAVILAAQEANEFMDQMALPAFQFPPGLATLQEAQNEYMVKVVTMLKHRPDLRVKLCPYSTGMDKRALMQPPLGDDGKPQGEPKIVTIEQLNQLSQSRVDYIKRKLVSQNNINPDQLIVCRPTVDETKMVPPRVELNI